MHREQRAYASVNGEVKGFVNIGQAKHGTSLREDYYKGNVKFYDIELYKLLGEYHEMVPKTGKVKLDHFAYKATELSSGGGGEGAIHYAGKKIMRRILSEKQVIFELRCGTNGCKQTMKILRDWTDGYSIVEERTSPEGRRPDLTVLNSKGELECEVEIVNTHPPSATKNPMISIVVNSRGILNWLAKYESYLEMPTDEWQLDLLFRRHKCENWVCDCGKMKKQLWHSWCSKCYREKNPAAVMDDEACYNCGNYSGGFRYCFSCYRELH